jgi:maleylpyruvate isomerase
MLTLYEYFRSSSSFRTRIALNLKGLEYRHVPVHLRRNGGEQFSEDYRRLNPQQLVPTLVDDAGNAIAQSLAIIEYLEETHPQPALLPHGPLGRARVRSLAQFIACEMHPLNNLRVLLYLRRELGQDDDGIQRWIHTWLEQGFEGLEGMLSRSADTGHCCHGDHPTLADVCLVPQVANAQRFDFDVSRYATVWRIHDHCMSLEAFEQAKPANQPDAE